MTRVLVQELDMGLGTVAQYQKGHHLLHTLSPETLAKVPKNGSISMFLGGGSLLREICRLNYNAGPLMVGSSANVTGSGQKFRVEDIEDEIKESVDLIVDYGLQRYHIYGGRVSINMDFDQMKILRMGARYELFRERIQKFWGVDLPEDRDYKIDHV